MTISLTNIGTQGADLSSVSNTMSITGVTVPAHNLIIVAVAGEVSTSKTSGVTDSAGNSYTQVVDQNLNNVTTFGVCRVYYAFNNIALSSQSITFTINGLTAGQTPHMAMTAFYVSGARISSDPNDSAVTAKAGSGGPITSGTPSKEGEVFIAILGALNGSPSAIDVSHGWSTAPPTSKSFTGSNADVEFIGGGWQVNTGTGTKTYAPTGGGDNSIAIIGFICLDIMCAAGSYTVTGSAAGSVRTRVLACAAGSYSITGTAAAGVVNAGIDPGVYSITGQPAALLYDRTVLAAAGSYAITGDADKFVYDKAIPAAAGVYSITGQPAATINAYVLPTSPGGIDGSASNSANGDGSNAVSAALTTHHKDDEILAYVATVSKGGAKAVSSVTSAAGLSFFKRGSVATLTASGPDGTYTFNLELWFASAASPLAADTITANTAAVSGTASGIAMVAFGASVRDKSNLFNFAEVSGSVADSTAGGPTYSTTGGRPTLALMGGVPNPVSGLGRDTIAIGSTPIATFGALEVAAFANPTDVSSATNLQSSSANLNAWEYIGDGLNADTFNIAGYAASLATAKALGADAGSYAITGDDAALLTNKAILCAAGSYSLSGDADAFLYDRVLPDAAGSYSLSGSDASLLYDRVLADDAGSYSIGGSDASLLYDRIIAAAAGSYAIDGDDADLIFTPVSNPTLLAAEGEYLINGHAARMIFTEFDNDHPGRGGRGGGGGPPKDHPCHPGELELFRSKLYGRGIDAMVPPGEVAHAKMTTTQHPTSRPVTRPVPPGRNQ